MKALILVLLLSGYGCANMKQINADLDEYAPSGPMVGEVTYLNQGADWVIKRRRASAYKKMYNICNGKYKITDESIQRTPGSVSSINPWGFSSNNVHLKYKCLQDGE